MTENQFSPSAEPEDPGGPEEIRSLRLLSGRIAAEEPAEEHPPTEMTAEISDSIRRISDQMAQHFSAAFAGLFRESRKDSEQRAGQILENLAALSSETQALGERVSALRRGLDGVLERVQSAANLDEVQRKLDESAQRTAELLKSQTGTIEKSHKLLDAQTEAVSKQSWDLQHLRQELLQQAELVARNASATASETAQIKNQIEPLEQRLRDLNGQVDLSKQTGVQFEDRFAALERRLDSQAEVIKALHSVAQSVGARQEMIQAMLLKAQEMSSAASGVKPLPDSL